MASNQYDKVTEKFKDTKVVVRSRKSKKGRQYNGQKERDKKNKQWYTKHYTGHCRLSNTNPL